MTPDEFPQDEYIDSDMDDEVLIIAVTADQETWLPQITLGIPVDDPDEEGGTSYVPVTLSPDEAYQIGAYLIRSATTVSSFYVELQDRSIEERKEILSLESQFLDSPF